MWEEIAFDNCRISDFQGLVTLTLDRVILHTLMHQSSASTYIPKFLWTATYCQLQSHVTEKLGQKSKIRPRMALGIVP